MGRGGRNDKLEHRSDGEPKPREAGSASSGNPFNMPKEGYDEAHGDDGGVLRSDEEPESAGSPEAGAPSPSIDELCELNRRIHEDARVPGAYALDQRAPLLGCLEAVCTGDTSTPEGVIRAAALLAHGIAQAQSFRDGNRRTAYTATRVFLERHGLGHLNTDNDEMLARYLNQVVTRQSRFGLLRPPGPDKFEDLFLRRLARRKPGGTTS